MKRKPPIRYVDMAIYVDNNIFSKDTTVIETIYDYLTMLAYMLSCKRRFFNKEEYYDGFAKYLAEIVYLRMIDKRQWLDESDPNYLSPIKSCLNYMKQILYAKKCEYTYKEFNHTSATKVEYETYKEYETDVILRNNNDILILDIELYFNAIDKIVKDVIYNGVYGNDKLLCWRLYVSCLLTLLRNFTLSNKNKYRLSRTKNQRVEDLLESIMIEETATAPVVYNLSNDYLDYVAVMNQKIKSRMIEDIKELSREYDMSDEMIEDILMFDANFDSEDSD